MEILKEIYASHYLSNLHYYLIASHITLAIVALIAGPIPMIARKGGINHRRVGKVFLWSMVTSLLIAIVLLFFRFNVFLAGITALSLNSVVTGVRSLYRKRAEQNAYLWFDYLMAIATLITGVGLFLLGALTGLGVLPSWIPSGGSNIILTILPIVFGVLLISDSTRDIRSLRTPSTDPNWWWYYHMERMLGSYIALVTALAVQQIGPRMPESIMWLSWVAPSAIGTPLIALWIKQYHQAFQLQEQTI